MNRKSWSNALVFFEYSCAYCGTQYEVPKAFYILTEDHVTPKSLGGSNSKYNIVPSCGDCNSRKSNIPLDTWFKKQPFYSFQRLKRIKQWQGQWE